MKTKLLVEQHFHGAFGIDFNNSSVDDILFLSKEIIKYGIGFIYPTLVTDSIENINKQCEIIKQAADKQTSDMAKICGIHLEGIFLNPEKKGIHSSDLFLEPSIDNFSKIDCSFIKIVTLAPELASKELIEHLKTRGIKIQAGHFMGGNLALCDGVTHTFNAMPSFSHRGESALLDALTNDNLYTEVIADGVHVSDKALALLFRAKPVGKILLVSDCLPCTKSNLKEFYFAGENIFYDGVKATSKEGTLAGSTSLLPDIIKLLASKGLFKEEYINNSYSYHNLTSFGEVLWDEKFDILEVKY